MIDWVPMATSNCGPGRTRRRRPRTLLKAGKNLFARKFEADVDADILTLLERRIELETLPVPVTRYANDTIGTTAQVA
jgi:hexokinase